MEVTHETTDRSKRRASAPHYAPPDELGAAPKALWAAVVPDRVRRPERLVVLKEALRALELADRAWTEAQSAPALVDDRGRPHPALRIWQEARRAFLDTWGGLGLAHIPTPLDKAFGNSQ